MNIIKKIAVLLFILSFSISNAQDKTLGFGFTAGFNYNSNGEYVTKGTLTEISKQFESDKKTGYHAGIYIQYGVQSLPFPYDFTNEVVLYSVIFTFMTDSI